MKSTMLFARYVLFGLFVVCNAIICSVAVWNHSLVQATGGQTVQVDVYLIFLGAFSLTFIFPIIFADLLCTDPLSARVWFECAWVTIIWLMQLAGAAAVTAIAPHIQCSAQATEVNNNSCFSTNVLVAFTWICTIILLLYLSLLFVTAVTTQWTDPGVWHHNVRYLRMVSTRQCLPSAQNSPITPRFVKGRGTSEAHKPRSLRPVAPNPVYGYRAGLGPEYEIEHYRPHETQHNPVDSALSLRETMPAHSVSYPSPARVYSQRIRGLIPPEMDLPPLPSRLHTAITYSKSVQSSISAHEARASSPSPSHPYSLPFDWPRANSTEQPFRTKRKPPPSTSHSVQSSISAHEARASSPSPSHPFSSPFDRPRANAMEQPFRTKRKPPPSTSQEARTSPSPSPPSSSPFDWPRANVMEQPIKTKRKPPPSAFEFPKRSAQAPSELFSDAPPDSLTHPRTRRPSGPRVRPPSADETQHPNPHLARPAY
ncbi:uncharacterized protein F5147DRAFT_674277 [Suillus discolor]|uniref:MARVEL domain-containing protein n=1 Tax=Suillus discolor TaxID=1912936 RepID=A0A9P7JZC3_9AGAM|nr:uncharacterized protein F5147DRAFT_674277 [Suillus discolor]KAG2116754.1 hypothetical protein F5147DRAFT_674277 [Suillus discolor]